MVKVLSIGRDSSCEINIPDQSVSRRHAQIFISNSGKLFLLDCNSSYGSFIVSEGKKIQIYQSDIVVSDTLYFGNYSMSGQDLYMKIRNSMNYIQTGMHTARRFSRRLIGN